MEKGVDASVQHDVHTGSPAGVLDRHQPLDLALDVDHSAALVVGVLEVEPHRARPEQALNQLARREPITRLEVGGHGHVHDRGDAAHGREHLGRRRHVAVLVPERLGHAGARGGDRWVAVVCEAPRARRIPRVHEQQRRARHVQSAQLVGLGGQDRGVHDTAARTTGRSSRSRRTSTLQTTSITASTTSGVL